MSYLSAWIHSPVAQALGGTLAHFLWEGAVLAALLAAMLRLGRAAPARKRYALACLILAAMPLAFAATFAVMWSLQPPPVAVAVRWAPIVGTPVIPAAVPAPRWEWADILDRLPWLVPLWFVGVAFFYARGVAGWAAAQRLRRRGVCAPPPEWQARLNHLAERLRLSRPVALLESCLTDTPVLIGYLRPVVLLPLGCLTGLSAAQVECILLHELAHVGRHDYVVNLLQSVVEGLLFYHPAVWWVSRVVRAERENCCDDRVVELMGDARSYAATLAVLEQRRALAPQAALAASGGNLIRRIRRLTTESRGAQTSALPAVSAGLLLVLFAAAMAAVPAKLPLARHPRMAAPLKGAALAVAVPQATPYQKWLDEDVAYIVTNEERAAFERLSTDAERELFIEAFWQRRGPQFKEEHYRRIVYANQHFASGIPGWRTDRGRIYITYGAPDEIEDHPSDGSTVPSQQWLYRHIDGIGDNVIVEFVDPTRSGEFHMTMDPSAAYALTTPTPLTDQERRAKEKQLRQELATPYRKWLNEDAAYIITDEERAAFVRLQADAERETFMENFWLRRDPTPGTVENEFKEEHYRRIAYANEHFSTGIPGWKTDQGRIYIQYGPPDAIQTFGAHGFVWTYRYIEGVGKDVAFTFADSPDQFLLKQEPGPRRNEGPKPDQNVKVPAGLGSVPSVSVIGNIAGYLSNPSDNGNYPLTAGRGGYTSAIASAVNRSVQALQSSPGAGSNSTVGAEKSGPRQNEPPKPDQSAKVLSQEEPALSVSVIQIAVLIDAVEHNANAAAILEREISSQQAECAGLLRIYQPQYPDVLACGDRVRSLEQRRDKAMAQAAIGPNSTMVVRSEKSADKMVTIQVQLGSSKDESHVFGEVIAQGHKVIQSFEGLVSGQPSLTKAFRLRPGAYHMVVVAKDMATGAVRSSELDFTVD